MTFGGLSVNVEQLKKEAREIIVLINTTNVTILAATNLVAVPKIK
jgi:hypothetical protein